MKSEIYLRLFRNLDQRLTGLTGDGEFQSRPISEQTNVDILIQLLNNCFKNLATC